MWWLTVPRRAVLLPAQSGIIPRGTMVEVFEEIYLVFLVLGTLVGIVVIGYMCYLGYQYRDTGDGGTDDGSAGEGDGIDRPTLGELPAGSGGGRKLFTSLALSAVIVISLIAWTYGTLLFVEGAPAEGSEDFEVQVTGYQFGWEFEYPNGHTTDGTLRVPADERIDLAVTSRDVWHNFGIPAFKVKSDAIPGQQTDSWFVAERTGRFQAVCYELCGAGHSAMNADVIVMSPQKFEQWYANTSGNGSSNAESGNATNATGSGANATGGTNTTGNGSQSALSAPNALPADTTTRSG